MCPHNKNTATAQDPAQGVLLLAAQQMSGLRSIFALFQVLGVALCVSGTAPTSVGMPSTHEIPPQTHTRREYRAAQVGSEWQSGQRQTSLGLPVLPLGSLGKGPQAFGLVWTQLLFLCERLFVIMTKVLASNTISISNFT